MTWDGFEHSTPPSPEDILGGLAEHFGASYAEHIRRGADVQAQAWRVKDQEELHQQLTALWHTASSLLSAVAPDQWTPHEAAKEAMRHIKIVATVRLHTEAREAAGGDPT